MTIKVREGLAVAAAEGVDIPAEEADHILQKVMMMVMMMIYNYDDNHDNVKVWSIFCKTEGDCQQTGEQDLDVCRRPQKEVFPTYPNS